MVVYVCMHVCMYSCMHVCTCELCMWMIMRINCYTFVRSLNIAMNHVGHRSLLVA